MKSDITTLSIYLSRDSRVPWNSFGINGIEENVF
jgi:hypothetical protein